MIHTFVVCTAKELEISQIGAQILAIHSKRACLQAADDTKTSAASARQIYVVALSQMLHQVRRTYCWMLFFGKAS